MKLALNMLLATQANAAEIVCQGKWMPAPG